MTDYADISHGGLSAQLVDLPDCQEPPELTETEMREAIEDAVEEMDEGDIKKLYDHLLMGGWIVPE